MWLSGLRVPDGHGTGVDTIAKSSNDATDDHLWDAVCSSLDGGTDDEYSAAEHDSPPSTEHFTVEEGKDGAKETANLVYGNHSSLKRGRAGRTRCGV